MNGEIRNEGKGGVASSRLAAMAESSRSPEQRCGPLAIANLPEEIVSEILLLLPPKSILQCRAVCKAWRAVISDRAFLLAHHRRQPPRRLLTFVRDVGGNHDDLEVLDYCVEALDFRTHEFLSVARFTGKGYNCLLEYSPFVVHAACDGLLLMSYNKHLHLCNPTTRQWLWVFPPALQHDKVVGLYYAQGHSSNSEYRVLYYRTIGVGPITFYRSTVGSGKESCIWPMSLSASLRTWLAKGSEGTEFDEPFLFHGNLHWLPHLGQQNNIVMFDTVDEVFRWLHLPFKMRNAVSLLEIEGTLAMSNSYIESSKVDLWLLLDYKEAVWVHKYSIELPVIEIRRFEEHGGWCSHIVSEEGDVLVVGCDWQLHYGIKGNLLEKFRCNGRLLNYTAHIHRESLVPDALFQNVDNESRHAPHFFSGL